MKGARKIIKKQTAQKLVKAGKAKIEGYLKTDGTYPRYGILTRYDIQVTQHFES